MRGVGSSHRGYSIFFGKFFKKSRIFAGHNKNFQKNPNFRPNLSKLWPTHPDFGSKTDFIFAQECLRFRKPEVLWMHALINTTLEIARNGSACACSLATTVTGYAQNDRSAMA